MVIELTITTDYFEKIGVAEEIGQGSEIILIKIAQGNELNKCGKSWKVENLHCNQWKKSPGWMGVKAVLRIAFRIQKNVCYLIVLS